MVVNHWKLNESATSNKFPLPQQEDILQALKGSPWLIALNTSAEFIQLEITPKEWEKLTFKIAKDTCHGCVCNRKNYM